MSADWDKPITKPAPTPVPSEAFRMTVDEREAAQMAAEHFAGAHELTDEPDCRYCRMDPEQA